MTETPRSPGPPAAPPPGEALERALLDAYTRRDADVLAALLAVDFRELTTSGDFHDRASVLAALSGSPEQRIELEHFSGRPLAEGLHLHTYRTTVHRPDRPRPSRAWRTSIWRREQDEGAWRLVFHQGSRIADPQP